MDNLKTWFLSLPRDIKLKMLEDEMDEEGIGNFIQLSKILLDAPIGDGGIETEAIDSIYKRYCEKDVAQTELRKEGTAMN